MSNIDTTIPYSDKAPGTNPFLCLNPEQWAVLAQLARGMRLGDIALEKNISISGAKSRVNRLNRALGVRGRHAALVAAAEVGAVQFLSGRNKPVSYDYWKRLRKGGAQCVTTWAYDDDGCMSRLTLRATKPGQNRVEGN